ncbi:hypothetical protein Dsin_013146 [Dipteronia sinensis]|uniref:Uncharacterized protein n=1 Tax=Dipteronia sinensis TaxID=43782 RepID=A0AAE0AJD8_9ROSI|nr:hypothetical protein Dsin_013146 [Dipteronia sinensis]
MIGLDLEKIDPKNAHPYFCINIDFNWVFVGKNLEMAAAAAAAAASPSWDFSCDLEVDFESDENASIVYAALAIDKELQPDKVKRQMSVANGKLSVHFEGVEARFLRASFSAFVDVLTLATKTIEQFDQGMDL